MSSRSIFPQRRYAGITYIYGLVDPLTSELRYIGKTVLSPSRRLVTHRWQARTAIRKRYVLAWLAGLEARGVVPEIVEIERVPPHGDWEEAEQFWIEYFKSIGAQLCNLTFGGEGSTGAKVSEAQKEAKRAKCGPLSPLYKRPKPPHVHAALKAGNEKLQSDPERKAAAEAKRRTGFTPAILAGMTSRLAAIRSDPVRFANREKKRKAACRTAKFRARVGIHSTKLWATKRDEIIAAQNAGKGEEFLKKQSASHKALWADPNSVYWKTFLSPAKREHIRQCLRNGMKGVEASKKFGLSQSRISQIKLGA